MTCTAPSCPRRAMRTERRLPFALPALLALLLAPAAHALQTDRQQPLQVYAKQSYASQTEHIAKLTGNVTLTQGSMHGDADRATIYTDANNQVTRVVMHGNPAHISQQQDGGGEMHGSAQTIDYTPDNDTAILTGDAHIDQPGRGSFSGARLVYNTQTEAMQGEGGSGLVHLVFQPRQKTAKPAHAASSAKPAHPASTPVPGTSPPVPAASSATRPASPVVPPPASSSDRL